MITTYLITTLWDWFIKEALALWFMLIHPFLPGIENITYFSTISLSILGLIYVAATDKRCNKSTKTDAIRHWICWRDSYSSGCRQPEFPLPERTMVLSTILLRQSFVGWLTKMGKSFLGTIDPLHRIGSNAIWAVQLSNAHYSTINKRRIDKMSEHQWSDAIAELIYKSVNTSALPLIMTGIAESTRRTSMYYVFTLILLRIISL